jgi:hypothetical protein
MKGDFLKKSPFQKYGKTAKELGFAFYVPQNG